MIAITLVVCIVPEASILCIEQYSCTATLAISMHIMQNVVVWIRESSTNSFSTSYILAMHGTLLARVVVCRLRVVLQYEYSMHSTLVVCILNK